VYVCSYDGRPVTVAIEADVEERSLVVDRLDMGEDGAYGSRARSAASTSSVRS
jgi:hypothetical protein